MARGRFWIDGALGLPIVAVSAAITDTPSGAAWTEGFVWLRAGALVGGAPDDRWWGLLVSSGRVEFPAAPVVNGDGVPARCD